MSNKRIDLTQFEGHTMGPWRYNLEEVDFALSKMGMMIMAGETMVAELSHLMTNMSPETDEINPSGLDPDAVDARVILASPDLIAELKRCYRVIEDIESMIPDNHEEIDPVLSDILSECHRLLGM